MIEDLKEKLPMKLAVFIFCLLSTVVYGIWIIPLCWCIPMTVYVYKYYKGTKDLGVGFKICTLLFVNMIGGILLLCTEADKTPLSQQ